MNCKDCAYFNYLDNTDEHNYGVCCQYLRLTEISDYCSEFDKYGSNKYLYLTEGDYNKILNWAAKQIHLSDIMVKLP